MNEIWWFETEHCKIRYLEEIEAVNIKWFGYARSEEFRLACNKALDLMEEKKSHKFLTDNSEAVVFSTDDQKWLNEDWIPRAKFAGYKVSATILSQKQRFTKLAVDNIVHGRGKEFDAQSFYSVEEAKIWLKIQ
jgi:hypothetical protein